MFFSVRHCNIYAAFSKQIVKCLKEDKLKGWRCVIAASLLRVLIWSGFFSTQKYFKTFSWQVERNWSTIRSSQPKGCSLMFTPLFTSEMAKILKERKMTHRRVRAVRWKKEEEKKSPYLSINTAKWDICFARFRPASAGETIELQPKSGCTAAQKKPLDEKRQHTLRHLLSVLFWYFCLFLFKKRYFSQLAWSLKRVAPQVGNRAAAFKNRKLEMCVDTTSRRALLEKTRRSGRCWDQLRG